MTEISVFKRGIMMKNGSISIDSAVAAIQKSKEKEFWKKQFSGIQEKVYFPYDITSGDSSGTCLKKFEFQWSGELFEKMNMVMKGSDYKLYMILLAVLFLLLNKYTGKDDITLGAPVLKQNIEGKLINTMLAFRIHIDRSITFKEFLLRVRQVIIKSTEHQNYPIKSLINQLYFTESENEEDNPLFDSIILLTDIHEKKYSKDIRVNTIFSFSKADNSLKCELEYNSSRYNVSTIENLEIHFTALISEVLKNPNIKLKEVEIVNQTEKKRLLAEFNNSKEDFNIDRTLGEIFAEQAESQPNGLAAVFEETQISYRETQKKANQIADLLEKKGIKNKEIIGLMVDRSLEMLFGILGILNAGGAYLPLDSEYPGDRNLFLIKDSRTRFLLWQTKTMENNREILSYLSMDQTILLDDLPENSKQKNGSRILIHPNNPAYVIYTSGTSGIPKGVIVEHRNVVNLVYGLEMRIYNEYKDRMHVCMLSPYVFDASVKQIFAALLLGHALYVVPQEIRADAIGLIHYYYKHQIEISDGTPTHISLLLENFQTLGDSGENIGIFPVKLFIVGGEALSKGVPERFLSLFDTHPPAIMNVYGPTECCVDASSFKVSQQNLQLYQGIPIGKPMPNYYVYIIANDGTLQPHGINGELCISGSGVSRGYLNRPELTAEKFIRNPFFHQLSFTKNRNENKIHNELAHYRGDTLYKTGDLAKWLPDGNLEYIGRIDRQIKIRGFRVELGEIESQLLNYSNINAAVVVLREDRENDNTLCAYIVSKVQIQQNEIRDFLAARLPYYLIPQYFISLEKIPLTVNGKIDRKALPAPQLNLSNAYAPPQNKTEEELIYIWSEILNIEKDIIGINNNFFELGGNSLSATILANMIHKKMNVKMPLSQVFNHPTVNQMSLHILESAKSDFSEIKPAGKKDYYPLSSAQKRLYLLQKMKPDSKEYNLPIVVVKIEGPLNRDRLNIAFKEIIKHHEGFRTSFVLVNLEPMQQIHHHVEFEYDYFESDEENVLSIVNNYIRPFDLEKAPLMRVGLVKLGEQSYVLMVDMHHIISDATSTQIFIHDLLTLYNGKQLPEVSLTYKDFSEWHNHLIRSGEIKKQEEFWFKEFAGDIPLLDLPLDGERSEVVSYEGNHITFRITKEETQRLRELALQEGVTLFMLFISMFYIFLHKLSGQEDIVLGTDALGRRHADLSSVIGMFVNTIVLRNYPIPNKTYREFLSEVKTKTLQAFDNQDYQFESLVEKVIQERKSNRNPLFDVMFSFRNIKNRQTNLDYEQIFNDLKISQFSFKKHVAVFDLSLIIMEINNNFDFNFDYRTQLFKKETIEKFILYFKTIMSEILKNPNKKIHQLEMVPEKEKEQLRQKILQKKEKEFLQSIQAEQNSQPDSEAEAEFDL